MLWIILALVAVSVILLNVCLAPLQAFMEIGWMALAERAITPLNFCSAAVLFLFFGALPPLLFLPVTGLILLISYLVPLPAAALQVRKVIPPLSCTRLRLFLPSGFWPFVVWAEIGIATAFVLDRSDQVLVITRFSLAQLGIYRAALVTAQLVRWLPLALSATLLPTLVNLLSPAPDSQCANRMDGKICFLLRHPAAPAHNR